MQVILIFAIVGLFYYALWAWGQYIKCRDEAESELWRNQSEEEKERWWTEFRSRSKERQERERNLRSCENPDGPIWAKIINNWLD